MHSNWGDRDSDANSHALPHPKPTALDGTIGNVFPSKKHEELRSKLIVTFNVAVRIEEYSATTASNDSNEHPKNSSIYKR